MSSASNTRHKEDGISLLECLVGLLLTSVLAGLLIAQVHPLLITARKLSDEAQAQRALARLSTILDTATTAIDSHRLSIAATIHPHGNVVYTDGTPHQIQHAPEKALQPSAKADAFSVLQLEMEHLLTVSPRPSPLHFPSGAPIQACSKTRLHQPERPRSVLAISVDGPSELVVSNSNCAAECCDLWLHAERSVIAPQSRQNHPLVLIPIKHLSTYYVTESGVLRTLQHVGEAVIENQPILAECPPFRLTFQQSPTPALHLKLEPPAPPGYHLWRFSRLSRLPYYHLLTIAP